MLSEDIRVQCHRMKVGERLRIHRSSFDRAFPCGWPTIYSTPEEAFLSGMIGSAWGSFRTERDIITGDVTVSRHEEGRKRYYADPDDAHRFVRMPDGTLEHVDSNAGRKALEEDNV